MEPQKRMKPEVREPWVAALLSDEYQQGSGHLIDTVHMDGEAKTTHCCLGVLCDLAMKAGVDGIRLVEKAADYGPVPVFEWRNSEGQWMSTEGTLPLPVREWAGLDSDDPYLDEGRETTAVEANDSLLWTFTDIAKSISENL